MFPDQFPKSHPLVHPIHRLFSKSFCSRWSVATSRLSSGSCQGTPQKNGSGSLVKKRAWFIIQRNEKSWRWIWVKVDQIWGQQQIEHHFGISFHRWCMVIWILNANKWNGNPWKFLENPQDPAGTHFGEVWCTSFQVTVYCQFGASKSSQISQKIVSSVGVGQDRVPRNSGMADHPISQPKKPHVATVKKNLTGVEIYRKLWSTDPNLGASCKCSLTNLTND